MTRLRLVAVLTSGLAISCASQRAGIADRDRLLQLHAEVMDAHRTGDVERILRDEPQDYVIANRGEVSRPTMEERRGRLGPYLSSTRFTTYRDVREPIVHVSRDGTLGWVIVQVQAEGEQASDGNAKRTITFESAWIELYEKRNGTWLRVGNVSNFRP